MKYKVIVKITTEAKDAQEAENNAWAYLCQCDKSDVEFEVQDPEHDEQGHRIRNPNATPEDQCFKCPDKYTANCTTEKCLVE
jgi:hypothetical protein